MNANQITIALIGIPSIEEKRLNAAFLHSKSRHTAYTVTDINKSPQILMINADEPPHLIQWQQYRNKLKAMGQKQPSSVLVSKNREFKTTHYQVRRPLIASKTISVLDRITANEFKIQSEVAILSTTQSINNQQSEVITTSNETSALVIDDSLPVRIQMKQALKSFMNHVDFAESGEEAFALIDKNQYQIIFLDVILPGMDGYEICKIIKQGRAKDTPIIMLTGNSSPADKVKGKLAGCDTYLIKPVGQTIFKEVVAEFLNLPNANSAMA